MTSFNVKAGTVRLCFEQWTSSCARCMNFSYSFINCPIIYGRSLLGGRSEPWVVLSRGRYRTRWTSNPLVNLSVKCKRLYIQARSLMCVRSYTKDHAYSFPTQNAQLLHRPIYIRPNVIHFAFECIHTFGKSHFEFIVSVTNTAFDSSVILVIPNYLIT